GKLILLYDKNNITIAGDTATNFNDDIATRFIAQGWQVIRVPDANDMNVLKTAIERAKSDLTRPSIIICTTKIGYGCPLEGSEKVHGAPMGEENLAKLKERLNWTEEPFDVPEDVKEYCRAIAEEKSLDEENWNKLFEDYATVYPELADKYKKYMSGYELDYNELFSKFDFSSPEATRASGGKILNEIATRTPNLLSGSADLAPSTLTGLKCSGAFTPENREGRNIQFGIREHAMAAICNGIQVHGGLRIVCSTFFSFSDYMKGGIRMSALMKAPVIYVMTHDSIGVGEDGPTHQPMEQLIALRSIPDIKVFRPCDGKETVAAYVSAFTGTAPTVLVLSRQNLNQYANSGIKAITGGYVLEDCKGTPDVILMGTGSEVDLCAAAKKALEDEGIKARVVSMLCLEEFENQTEEYQESVLPKSVKARVCVEAASHFAWYKYSRDYGEVIAMHSFGTSAPAKVAFEHFGFTVDNVVEKAKLSLSNSKKK
ncbi:MAG: transketolase, partial [Clostridia bacterium]|nr:transketolase [Clostridia bacterium]